uniref:Uncharacterized protein n=1 Tax=Phlebotomus papatasi TaxID=29031 RepID=A0A1B0D2L9_PHLPP
MDGSSSSPIWKPIATNQILDHLLKDIRHLNTMWNSFNKTNDKKGDQETLGECEEALEEM